MSRAFVDREPYITRGIPAAPVQSSTRADIPRLPYPALPQRASPKQSETAKPCSAQPNIAGTIRNIALPIRDCLTVRRRAFTRLTDPLLPHRSDPHHAYTHIDIAFLSTTAAPDRTMPHRLRA